MKEKTVFEDVDACQELCRILLRNQTLVLQSVRTQYVIRNLETRSMELDILAEQNDRSMVGIEIQMYTETVPLKRTRYYLCGIDMSILEKGKDYDELPAVTMVYITKKDFIGGGRGCYLIERKVDGREKSADINNELQDTIDISNGVKHFKIHKGGVDIMCEIADRIRNEGKNEGKVESKMEDILELLEELGQVPQRIVELISAEENLSVLSRWLKSAARATSITEFEANM